MNDSDLSFEDSDDLDMLDAPELESVTLPKKEKKNETTDSKPQSNNKTPPKPKKKGGENIFKKMARGLFAEDKKTNKSSITSQQKEKQATLSKKTNQSTKPKQKHKKNQEPPSNIDRMMGEIKNNMQNLKIQDNKEFLTQIQNNEVLKKGFSNAKIMQQVAIVSKNPQAVKQFSQDPEFAAFMKEYMKLLGNSFTQMGQKQKKENSRIKKQSPVMTPQFTIQKTGNPQVDSILEDKKVRELLLKMNRGERIELNRLAAEDPKLAYQMRVLLQSGFLRANA